MAEIELLEEGKDNGRKVIPFNTGRVQIGRAYQPKPTITQARWIERHTRPRLAVGKWLGYSMLAVLALFLIAARG